MFFVLQRSQKILRGGGNWVTLTYMVSRFTFNRKVMRKNQNIKYVLQGKYCLIKMRKLSNFKIN